MARTRSLKPDFFKDEDLAEHPFWVRILFEGLWGQADREGRLEDRPMKLKAEIFPYDKVDVEKGIEALTTPKKHSPKHLPFIVRYEVEGERYIQILQFQRHQAPHHTEKESAIPPYNGDITVKERLLNSNSLDDHVKDNSIKSEGKITVNDPFDAFWSRYPRKVGKQDAVAAYKAALKTATAEEILAALDAYRAEIEAKGTEEQYVKHAATFLRKDRWRDYAPKPKLTPEEWRAQQEAEMKSLRGQR